MNSTINSKLTYKERSRRRRMLKIRRRITVAVSLFFLVVFTALAVSLHNGTAEGKTDKTKQLTSVYVEEGDSIWTIATRYYSAECGSMQEYVNEIRRTNNISGDRILYGFTLLVPYYN
ncbi:MAG: LysM peptidoglycan-binding domain-containing protein [Lachnospiraceae bacterium]|nr:LysM peptidoglycan-binding domain-containing protein [Lachnospiraceae bacterium]